MATQQSTCSHLTQNTMLSRRIIAGRAHFREIPAVWSSWQSADPCLAFAVTWDQREAENDFRGYSVRVHLGASVEPHKLALVAQGDQFHLAIAQADGRFIDATTSEVLADDVSALGPVVEESEYYTAERLRTHAPDPYEAVKAAVHGGFVIAAGRENKREDHEDGDFDASTTATAIGESPLFRLAEKSYRSSKAGPVDEDEDFALRLFAARCYLAGRASARCSS